ncbi:MAG TPA: hypothetical protein VFF86_04285, partial [Candidatus Methylomirabilis sp.]|nr:hypothetical protein [Candidatus Methylomirabilis sp.]
QMGEFEEALQAEARAYAIGEAAGDRQLQTSAAWASGLIRALMGDWEEGIEWCERALRHSPDPLSAVVASGWLGFAHLEKEDPARAIPLLKESVQRLDQFGFAQFKGWFTVCLADAYRLNGESEKARDLAMQGLAITREAKSLYGVGWAQRALGRTALARGTLSDAKTHLDEAVQSFTSIDARYDLGRTHLDVAALAHAQGKQAEAATNLGHAHRLFTASRVPKYVERTEQLAKTFGVALSGEPPDDLSAA